MLLPLRCKNFKIALSIEPSRTVASTPELLLGLSPRSTQPGRQLPPALTPSSHLLECNQHVQVLPRVVKHGNTIPGTRRRVGDTGGSWLMMSRKKGGARLGVPSPLTLPKVRYGPAEAKSNRTFLMAEVSALLPNAGLASREGSAPWVTVLLTGQK